MEETHGPETTLRAFVFLVQQDNQNFEIRISLKMNAKGLNVGKPQDTSAEMFNSRWLGFTTWVIKDDKIEDREYRR